MKQKLRLEYVRGVESPAAQVFLELARPYMAETRTEADEGIDEEKFLQSILRRQGEPDRWLALFMLGDEAAGFAHFKVDPEDRPGWGFVMEYYVTLTQRRKGMGKFCAERILDVLAGAGCPTAWLASHQGAEGFWRACGFDENGEFQRDMKIMTRSLAALHDAADGVKI